MEKKIKNKLKKDERECVNDLVSLLYKASENPIYIKVDIDSKTRVFSDGYDFTMAQKNKVMYLEGKRTQKESEKILSLLRDSQYLAATQILMADCEYDIIEFVGQKPNGDPEKIKIHWLDFDRPDGLHVYGIMVFLSYADCARYLLSRLGSL